MDLQHLSDKRIMKLEQQITELLKTMRSAKLSTEDIYVSLQELEQQLGNMRRNRYDETTSEYSGY